MHSPLPAKKGRLKMKDEKKIWDRLEDENAQKFFLFQHYLQTRSIEKVAKKFEKSISYIRNLAGKYCWRERAAEFDCSLIEDARAEIKSKLAANLLRQWTDCTELQQSAISALRAKDLSKASFKSLNEIYHSAAQLQFKLAENLKLLEREPKKDELTINIVPKYPEN